MSKSIKAVLPISYVSRSQLKQLLSISENVFARMLCSGKIPEPYDFDGNDRWNWPEVDECIKAKCTNSFENDENNDPLMDAVHEPDENKNGTTQRRSTH